MKILIVDDDENSRIYLERSLQAQKYEVDSAPNGIIALEKVRNWRPDLIISDILMPEMNGFELCRKIKADEQLRRIPFIFYTATFVEQKDEKLAMSLGASRFLLKPMDPADFFTIIEDVIEEDERNELPECGPPEDLKELCKMYEEAIARKLDKKVQELEMERKALREAVSELEKSNKDLEQFTKVASHDLKQPLRQTHGRGDRGPAFLFLTERARQDLDEGKHGKSIGGGEKIS